MRPFLEKLLDFVLERVDFESLFRFLLERLGLPESAIEMILDLLAVVFAENAAASGTRAAAVKGDVQSLLDRAKRVST